MIETIVIGLICVFLAYLGRYRRLSWGFGAAMTILFVFLAIQYVELYEQALVPKKV